MSHTLLLHQIVASLERRYPPGTAQDWDAVGLVVGDPQAQVGSVLFAVDPVDEVVTEAIEAGVDLIVTHHPLMLRGVTSVAADSPKGRIVHRLIRAGIALYVAHTNADAAHGGVNDALAGRLGLADLRPIAPADGDALDLLITYVPTDDAERVRLALGEAGAGAIGDYSGCAWSVSGTGEFTPHVGAAPAVGQVGEHTSVPETRIEMVLRPARRAPVLEALRRAHPYEEPAFSIVPTAPEPSGTGLGRLGTLAQEISLAELAEKVRQVLPATSHGIRIGGDPARRVRTVAVCGGSGDSLLVAVQRAGVDAYLTADLRHHPAAEALALEGAPALIDVAHWASEWPWLPLAAEHLRADAGASGAQLSVAVSELVTDPWTARLNTPN